MILKQSVKWILEKDTIEKLKQRWVITSDGAFYLTKYEAHLREQEQEKINKEREENKLLTMYNDKCKECETLEKTIKWLVEIIKDLVE